MFKIIKMPYKSIALALSLCTLIICGVVGIGTSLAWFTDTDTDTKTNNIFHFSDFKVEVSHRLENGRWETIEGHTDIFDDEALYEPGCVQVVYLKVENKGDRAFKFYTAVNVNGCSAATNVYGQKFLLQDHLKFGVITADSEEEMNNSVFDRENAVTIADMPLHNYYEDGAFELAPNTTKYIALIVRMPEEAGNIANYRGDTVPKVELGITVKADQITD